MTILSFLLFIKILLVSPLIIYLYPMDENPLRIFVPGKETIRKHPLMTTAHLEHGENGHLPSDLAK
ncbi:hypothetical protein SAMN05216243_1951 [Sediminibacillus albus]|uniref:Uncharacterized protein n=1 Tax=Sediminibacillus albus TaxID=407036 RepID=A0A1G8Z1N0_9BACI|nr:hypothetical protein SAMN05216243_1951 [Sediminibacillus albus]